MNSGYSHDPLKQFRRWFEEAGTEAVALATATADGAPSARIVLLKGADERGFTFFTNYESRKGRELFENPRAALLFHWPDRQVRIEGSVERVSAKESDDYWATRPPESQAAAWASAQSQVIDSLARLQSRVAKKWGRPQPRPSHWGGYRLTPHTYEFWEHRASRLHDRLRYRYEGDGWVKERLAP
jgi:pyridoxamine 5'-phosphate oxidase